MSPRVADPAVRVALIEHAARITAEGGRDALSLRRLASAVGVSTMAVYTHFGSMEDLRRAVRREGFERLAAHLGEVETTGDAMADLIVQGAAYYLNAIKNPNLYRAMFMDGPVDEKDADVGLYTFEVLVAAVERCMDVGRLRPADPRLVANQLWSSAHGVAALIIAGILDETTARATAEAASRNIIVACGDTPAALGRSLQRATPRIAGLLAGAGQIREDP